MNVKFIVIAVFCLGIIVVLLGMFAKIILSHINDKKEDELKFKYRF